MPPSPTLPVPVGIPYDDLAPELVEARAHAVELTDRHAASIGSPAGQRQAILVELLAEVGPGAFMEPTFRCEFGAGIRLGARFYANFDCVMLDAGGITIGDDVLLGPRVGLYTTNHSLDARERRAGLCVAAPITIGNRVWVGGGVQVVGGVSIGSDSVIGTGSVVTHDIPEGTVAAGVPCRVLRPVTDADRLGAPGWPPHGRDQEGAPSRT